jgi:C1A family cysteine protease
MNYSFGWLPDIPDKRDVNFRSVFRVPVKLPSSIDLRNYCSGVENQGNLGSCTAQALVGALEFLQNKALYDKENAFADLSRLFVYYNERWEMGTVPVDSGAMLRTGIKTLKTYGVCTEHLWPYKTSKFKDKPSQKCYDYALDHQITAYQKLSSLHEMKASLYMGLPFVFGFAVYEHVTSDSVSRTGAICMPKANERLLGGHAVMGVGYNDKSQTVVFRNSWGKEWGDGGYGTIPYQYLLSRQLTNDFWCIQSTESDIYLLKSVYK